MGSGLQSSAGGRGLRSTEVHSAAALFDQLPTLLSDGYSVIDLRFAVSEDAAASLYEASDGVLANSVSEPFGLVGLEAMAAGGVVYTGGTGEDYAVSGRNAVVLETLDASEIADRSEELASDPRRVARIRRAARITARQFTWDLVSAMLLEKAGQLARRQGLLPGGGEVPEPEVFTLFPSTSRSGPSEWGK
jgi:glycosyltransferase involved in cell wall biosynthesis